LVIKGDKTNPVPKVQTQSTNENSQGPMLSGSGQENSSTGAAGWVNVSADSLSYIANEMTGAGGLKDASQMSTWRSYVSENSSKLLFTAGLFSTGSSAQLKNLNTAAQAITTTTPTPPPCLAFECKRAVTEIIHETHF
jgi:hypothetical protein